MNTDNNGDFRDQLRGLGQAAAHHEPILPDDAATATIRSHAVNARRRERFARSGIAAVCVLTLVAGGFGAYKFVNTPQSPSFAGPAASPGGSEDPAVTDCGTDYVPPVSTSALSLVSEGHTDKEGNPLSTDAPDGKRWETSLVGYGPTIPLLLKNTSRTESFEGGSTGYAGIVVTQNGKIVANGNGVIEPWVSFSLKPGETSAITMAGNDPCPGVDFTTGDFEVTAILDYDLGDISSQTSSKAVGGPWSIHVGSTPASVLPSAELVGCGATTTELVASPSPNKLTAKLDTTGKKDVLSLSLETPRTVVAGSDLQIVILKDNAVVTSTPTMPEEVGTLLKKRQLTIEKAAGKTSGADCYGNPLTPGDYEIVVVSVMRDANDGTQLTHVISNRVPYTIK